MNTLTKNSHTQLVDDTLSKLDSILRKVTAERERTFLEFRRWMTSKETLNSKKKAVRRSKDAGLIRDVLALEVIAVQKLDLYEARVQVLDKSIRDLEGYKARVNKAKQAFSFITGMNYLKNSMAIKGKTAGNDPVAEIQAVRKAVFTVEAYREILSA